MYAGDISPKVALMLNKFGEELSALDYQGISLFPAHVSI
jgi:hypothetical protein